MKFPLTMKLTSLFLNEESPNKVYSYEFFFTIYGSFTFILSLLVISNINPSLPQPIIIFHKNQNFPKEEGKL